MCETLTIHTDGACLGNPGPGGWCAILCCGNKETILKGSSSMTTNNIMEMTAVIESLKFFDEHKIIKLYTDSQYVKKGLEEWVKVWRVNNWKTKAKKDVKNKELWKILDNLFNFHSVSVFWVKGHAGNYYNEKCDNIARTMAEEIKKKRLDYE